MNTIHFSWPEGNQGACTSSWDDGTTHDYRLVEMFDRYGLKATWNLNSGMLSKNAEQSHWKDYIQKEDVKRLYQDHEVAVHTVHHPRPWLMHSSQFAVEILEDKKALEALVGYPIIGFCYPFGRGHDPDLLNQTVYSCGLRYARSSQGQTSFDLPKDFLRWQGLGHYTIDLRAQWKRFCQYDGPDKLFNFWGHSYECEDRNNWHVVEDFCKAVADTEGIWHATHGQIYRYVTAWQALEVATDGGMIYNPSSIAVWVRDSQGFQKIAPGELLRLPSL